MANAGVQVHMQDMDVLVLFQAEAAQTVVPVAALAAGVVADQLVLLSLRLTHKG